MKKWKERYIHRFPEIINSYGDTPSCSLADELNDFDEIRPGNFVYYDLMQYQLGACTFDDIAVVVACPVVSVYPQRNELILYGGAVHLSNEHLADNNGRKIYGYVVLCFFSLTGAWDHSDGNGKTCPFHTGRHTWCAAGSFVFNGKPVEIKILFHTIFIS